MTKTQFSTLLLILFAGIPLFSQSDLKGTIEITFTGIRNLEGWMGIGVNYNPDGFPHRADLELQYEKDDMKDGVLTIQVKDMAYGTYAISALDDVDRDLEMRMFMGIPKEGYGFSRNPPFRLRAPHYDECSFELDQPVKKIHIELRYSGKDKKAKKNDK